MQDEEGHRESIGDLTKRLIADGKAFASAEIALHRARLGERARQAQGAIALLVVALVLVQATVTTLLVALVMVFEALLGIYWAAAIVVIGALVLTGVIAWVAMGKIKAALSGPEDEA